jgi:hypothetical protein
MSFNCVLWFVGVPAAILVTYQFLRHATDVRVATEPISYTLPDWAPSIVIQSAEIDLYNGALVNECVVSRTTSGGNCTCYDPANEEDSNSAVLSLLIGDPRPEPIVLLPPLNKNCTYHAHLMLMPRWYMLLGFVTIVAILLSCAIGCICLTECCRRVGDCCQQCCDYCKGRHRYTRLSDIGLRPRFRFARQTSYGASGS